MQDKHPEHNQAKYMVGLIWFCA